jgi:hypothetical protein
MPSTDPTPGRHPLAAPLYLIAFLLVATPLVDYTMNIAPFRFGDVGWRYGVVGLLSGFLLTPLLGCALAAAVASLARQPRMVVAVAALNVLGGGLLLVALLLFALDALQIRNITAPAQLDIFDKAVGRAMLKHLSTSAALLWLGIGGLRAGVTEPPAAAVRAAPAIAISR